MADKFEDIWADLAKRDTLFQSQTKEAFTKALNGELKPVELMGLLMGLHARGEKVSEIAGAAEVMRAQAVPVEAPKGAIDIVGTGGDGKHTLNISTATALVVAGAGVPVAKHGNRAITSKAGAADVLEALDIAIEGSVPKIEKAIVKANIGFLFARSLHPGMQYVTQIRQDYKMRTIFNILGPLCNPADVKNLLVGVFDKKLIKPMATVLALLGAENVWVVHGASGLDELSTTGINHVYEYRNGKYNEFRLYPEDYGFKKVGIKKLKGGTAEENAKRIEALLGGQKDAFRDVVLLNASAALLIAGKCKDLQAGKALAEESIDSGSALKSLQTLRNIMAS